MQESTSSVRQSLYIRSAPYPPTPGLARRERPSPLAATWHKFLNTPCSLRALETTTGFKDDNELDDAVLTALNEDFCDKIRRDIPVKEFIRHIWNFDERDHPTLGPPMKTFVPDPTAIQLYNQVPNGTWGHPHFEKITRTFLAHLFPASSVHTVHNIYAEVIAERIMRAAGDEDFRLWKDDNAAVLSQQTGQKRKFATSSDSDATESSPKRRKVLYLSRHEARAVMHMNEILAQGTRSYISGFLVRNKKMQLWYADRMGLVQSCAFNWQLRPDLLALVYAAIGTASVTQLGIIPFLECPPMTQEVNTYEGARIVLPANEAVFGDGQERPSENMVFKVNGKQMEWANPTLVGRGTAVVPVEAIGAAAERFGKEALVVKMAWPQAHLVAEERLIRVVRGQLQQKAPSYLRHIVDLKCFVTRNMEEMGLPRAFMDIELAEDDKRDFRLMVLKKYEELEFVESVDEFKTVFEHVVRAHHWVYATSGVLHCDISYNNVMFYRDAEGHAVGVLCDWDLAEEKLSDEEYQADDDRIFHVYPEGPTVAMNPQGSVSRYRTGTAQFTAFELLTTTEGPLYRYAHDLESLFSLLAYVCARFDPTKHRFKRFADNAWEDQDRVALSKMKFYTNGRAFFLTTFIDSHEDYMPLVDEWVHPLWILFGDVAQERIDIRDLRMRRDIHARFGRDTLAAELNAEIRQSILALREMVTYETFMESLGLPLHLPTDPHCPACAVH
ncbi:hypothetical protein B0H21DRAFT_576422 [Amylocystis lapponica]|nr:hypothetical protein B0H21DRAFT_576422 [Amylocystis lapponica]